MHQEKLAKIELDKSLNIEEAFWHDKVNVRWHIDGDIKNTLILVLILKVSNENTLI